MRRLARRIAPAATVVALSACLVNHGAREEYGEAVQRPYGDRLELSLRSVVEGATLHYSRVITGELLEVRGSALLIATEARFAHVPLAMIERPRFVSTEALRVRARYPHGLSDDQLARLLRAAGFERVDTLRAPARTPAGDTATVPAGAGASAGTGGAAGPPDPAALQDFLREAERAAAPYQALERAVAAGYRRLGPSFPGMGEHWIHPGLIVEGRVRPDRAPVLCYARVDGEPRLVAIAFAVPLEPGEEPPAHPAGREVWHDHSEQVDEETLLLTGPASHHGGDGPRLAMLHAWLWLDNPDGTLAQNNWRLPFLQAGLEAVGMRPSADAARGLSLHTAGPDYYMALFRTAAEPGPADRQALRKLLERHAVAAGRWAESARAPASRAPELAELEALWDRLWADVAAGVAPETAARLAPLR